MFVTVRKVVIGGAGLKKLKRKMKQLNRLRETMALYQGTTSVVLQMAQEYWAAQVAEKPSRRRGIKNSVIGL